MDLRSIVRAFRFGEMQRRSEIDPGAKRPPTILFAAVFLALLAATVGIGAGIYYLQGDDGADNRPLGGDDPDASRPAANATASSPTGTAGGPFEGPASGPAPIRTH